MTSTSSSRNRVRVRRRRAPSVARNLRIAGLSARKSLGQHFLISQSIVRRVVDACELSPQDNVIEIGAGLGALTEELAARARHVVAIELDAALAERLRQRFAGSNVSILQADALEVQPAEALSQARTRPPYVLAGNLPYYIAQPLLRHFLEVAPAPSRLIVMVQAEVAESIVAKPGKMTLLGVSVQLYGRPRLLFRVPPSAFRPAPKVSSAVVRIDVDPASSARLTDREAFFSVVRAGFATKRKQLRNALVHGLRIEALMASELLAAANIDPTLRAQSLPLEAWAALARAWIEGGRPEGTQ